jgi:hypothetical protein
MEEGTCKELAKTADHAHGIRTASPTLVQALPLHQPVTQQYTKDIKYSECSRHHSYEANVMGARFDGRSVRLFSLSAHS